MIVLYGKTSAEWWMHCGKEHLSKPRETLTLPKTPPSSSLIEEVRAIAPFLSFPLHCIASSKQVPSHSEFASVHYSSNAYMQDSCVKLTSNVHTVVPEVAFVQLGKTLSLLEMIELGSSICGAFKIAPASEAGTLSRPQLIAKTQLEEHINKSSGMQGVSSARKALPFVFENAYSPAEIKLSMRLCLPPKLGGLGLPRPVLNQKINLGPSERAIAQRENVILDLFWLEVGIAFEYDSNAHLSVKQLSKDATKRNALANRGITIITITALQLNSPLALRANANIVAKRLGVYIRPRCAGFAERQKELFAPRERFYWPSNAD